MFTIHLNNLKFFAFHGLYEEERVLGGEFEVSAAVHFLQNDMVNSLEQTVDYVKIYELIKEQMAVPTALLETVAQNLAHHIYAMDNRVASVSISITKLHPPITAFQGSVGVSYKQDF